jgi:hypothetical protein
LRHRGGGAGGVRDGGHRVGLAQGERGAKRGLGWEWVGQSGYRWKVTVLPRGLGQ